jgi:biotin carboxylase
MAVGVHQGDLAATAEWLRQCRVSQVLAGCETGVLLADALSATLRLPGNGLALSRARRDKTLMARAAESRGVSTPRQTTAADVGNLLAWIDGHGAYPVVVKPPHSLDSDGVVACESAAEVRAAAAALFGRRNQAGLINETVIVQELLRGDQYAVDTVSRDGRHLLAGIWRYSRPESRPGRPNYSQIGSDGKRMVSATQDRSEKLFAAACRVLDALEIDNGPAHCELMWTDDRPLLIEIGARLHGGEKTPVISRLCTGSSQLDRWIEALVEPRRFDEALDQPYPLRQHGAMVYLMPWRTGHLRGYGRLRDVARLPSFVELFNLAPPGPFNRRVAGLVLLVHPLAEVLEKDVAAIRAWERDGFYRFHSERKASDDHRDCNAH